MDAPKIEALTGPLKSATFALPDSGDVTLGRDDDNLIRIAHSSVSRHHCVLRRRGDGSVSVTDLGSRNGTLVNGVAVAGERMVKPGDEIHVGTSLFLLVPGILPGASGEQPVQYLNGGSRLLSGRTIEAGSITVQVVRTLDALLKASIGLGTASSFAEWERVVMEAVFALTSADRAGVIEPGPGGEIRGGIMSRARDGSSATLHVDPALTAQALAKNQTLCGCAKASPDSAILVSPIRTVSDTGIVYLTGKSFSEDDLQAAEAVATLAGLSWDRVNGIARLEAENQRLWSNIEHDLVGNSSCIEELVDFIGKVATAPSNILLLGESGTGKDLVAKAIHRNGPRARRPYITINCGAIPEALVESELFGAERGAYTGATTLRKGLFESAAGGTVFLDEISELPLSVQPALLRVLQNREVRRLGGTRTIPLDFRLIAASNRDLAEMVTQGLFRADLYHRLRVVSRPIPPLRERPEDIPRLAAHFVKKFAERSRPACRGVSQAALRALTGYSWPGNVRELENAVERAVVLGGTPMIELEDLPETILEGPACAAQRAGGFHAGVAAAKRRLVQDAISRGGSFVEAARILQINPNYLHRLVNNLELRRPVAGGMLPDSDEQEQPARP